MAERDDDRNDGGNESGEDEHERLNRELIELLNELRVALPGVQVLFAFLLAVPFACEAPQRADTRVSSQAHGSRPELLEQSG